MEKATIHEVESLYNGEKKTRTSTKTNLLDETKVAQIEKKQ